MPRRSRRGRRGAEEIDEEVRDEEVLGPRVERRLADGARQFSDAQERLKKATAEKERQEQIIVDCEQEIQAAELEKAKLDVPFGNLEIPERSSRSSMGAAAEERKPAYGRRESIEDLRQSWKQLGVGSRRLKVRVMTTTERIQHAEYFRMNTSAWCFEGLVSASASHRPGA